MSFRCTEFIAITSLALLLVGVDNAATAQAPQPLPRIPAGTKVPSPSSTAKPARWNQLVLAAEPAISSGDVNALSASMRSAATKLSLTIMATVTPDPNDGKFVLREVGVGYSVPIAGQPTIITSNTQSKLGANLGFIQRQMLSTNESQLSKVSVVVHTSTMLIFDAPAIMHRGGQHRNYLTRHLVWIDAKTGTGAMLAWLLGAGAKGQLQPANEPLRLIGLGTKEQRRIHVDGNEFTFSIPSERAFALEDLPPGRKVAWTRRVATVAALQNYSANDLVELSAAVNEAINPPAAK